MKTYLHKAPTYRHPTTKDRAVMFKETENTFFVSVFKFRNRYGNDVFRGIRSDCMSWLTEHGYNINSTREA